MGHDVSRVGWLGLCGVPRPGMPGACDGATQEIAAEGYARIPLYMKDLFSGNVAVTFYKQTPEWGEVTGWQVWDAPKGGRVLISGRSNLATGDSLYFPARWMQVVNA
jgi:hypothetical protein